MHILGVDIGGTGIKAAVIDTRTGKLIGDHKRIPTPKPATPENIAASLSHLITESGWSGPIGCGCPVPCLPIHRRCFQKSQVSPALSLMMPMRPAWPRCALVQVRISMALPFC